jgi:hypothetical protein
MEKGTALQGKKNRTPREIRPHLKGNPIALRGKQTAAKLLTGHGQAATKSCFRCSFRGLHINQKAGSVVEVRVVAARQNALERPLDR